MSKDPAVLFYIADWLKATKGMKADAKGWYLNLILFQFDMGDLPNDIEELANLCDVRMSEYEKFEQVFEQVLRHKFELNEEGRLENQRAKDIIQKREYFKSKRSNAGKMSYFIKYGIKKHKLDKDQIAFIKKTADLSDIDLKDEQVLKQVFKQMLELYRNGNEDIDIDYELTLSKYNEICKNLPKAKSLTAARMTAIKNRTLENGYEKIIGIFNIVSQSDYLNGKVNGWKASFDWIMTPSNFIKIVEGNYNNDKSGDKEIDSIATYYKLEGLEGFYNFYKNYQHLFLFKHPLTKSQMDDVKLASDTNNIKKLFFQIAEEKINVNDSLYETFKSLL